MCDEPALGRNGATLEHLVECAPLHCSRTPLLDPSRLRPGRLWKDPTAAVESLSLITALIRTTSLGEQRAAAAMAARKRTSTGAKR